MEATTNQATEVVAHNPEVFTFTYNRGKSQGAIRLAHLQSTFAAISVTETEDDSPFLEMYIALQEMINGCCVANECQSMNILIGNITDISKLLLSLHGNMSWHMKKRSV